MVTIVSLEKKKELVRFVSLTVKDFYQSTNTDTHICLHTHLYEFIHAPSSERVRLEPIDLEHRRCLIVDGCVAY